MRRKLTVPIVLISTAVSACSYDGVATKGGPICNNLQVVTVSRRDVLTDGTKRSIAGTNAVIETWCGERPIPKEAPPAPAKIASN